MKKVIVLGANGQLGKTLQSLVSSSEDTYYFYSKNEVDVTKPESLKTVFYSCKFDYCINCAAYTDVDGAENQIDLAFEVNATAVENIAHLCKENSVKLIHISTDYVFDGKKREPYTTEDKPNPINEYGKSKLKGESYIREILSTHYIIRTSWLYSLYGKNFFKTIFNKINENCDLMITTSEEGTPTSCVELSKFIVHLIKLDEIPYGTYHFTAKGNTTWYSFANEIAKKSYPTKMINIIPTDNYKTLAKRPKYSVLDISKTERVYKRLNKWQKSLKDLIDRQSV